MIDHVLEETEIDVTGPWSEHLRAMDRALTRRDEAEALRAWEHAHLAAVESLRWEGLIAAGQAYLRLGQVAPTLPTSEATARRAFFAALYRACRENSFDGVMRAADAFAALGDREVVDECLGLAELLAEEDEGRRRVAAFVEHLRAADAGGREGPETDGGRP
jgi:hypothetical protein